MEDGFLDDSANFEDTIEDIVVDIPKETRKLHQQSYDKSVEDLNNMMIKEDPKIKLDPDYQRNYLWDNKKSSLLIESILLNVPIPVIYLSENEDSSWDVIDGLQRLTSIKRFYNDEFTLRGLEILDELDGKKYSKLPPKARRIIDNGMIRVVVLLNETHPEIKYDIFMRLNRGSVKLNEQELRNCLYRGSFTTSLKDIRNNNQFLNLLNIKEPHNRYVDMEIILRFFAIHKNYDVDTNELSYPGAMKPFINNYMKENMDLSDDRIENLKQLFDETINKIFITFGEKAFFRITDDNNNVEKRMNRSLIDVLMLVFSRKTIDDCIKNKDKYKNILKELCTKNSIFIDSITQGTSDRKKIKNRLEIGLDSFYLDN